MTLKLTQKLENLRSLWQHYTTAREKLKEAKIAQDSILRTFNFRASQLAAELREKNLNEVRTDNATFRVRRVIVTKVSDRDEARKFDEKYGLGFFTLQVCGPRVKRWVLSQLEKNLEVPAFIDLTESWTIEIEELQQKTEE